MCLRALNAFASVLAVADVAFPNRDQRRMAEKALLLADDFRAANQLRDLMEDGE
jgi:hypothetical protein